ncbi:hypothetical protein AR686_04300 [Chryseobacterium aquaticum subsp. greenlandense]|uniref:Uncharacterized protein n=1 Tax=Chryseobacterium aquaticum subsp. greenlandense TaxID=345663 RepID=A0A117KCS8_9FLAO|nr:hypothetical protein AR686_04300 [Chryseobacterium aquaticum subsp. greenlandense]
MIIGIIYKFFLLLVTIKSYNLSRKLTFSTQNYLLIYLSVSLFIEVISFSLYVISPNSKNGLLYNLYNIFSISFFYLYFSKILKYNFKKLSFLITIISTLYILFFTSFLSIDFDKNIGITLLLFYLANSLLWFYQKISFFDDHKITDDPTFWISTGLLMWSCFFLFRVTPMFYFAKEDKEFLEFLKVGQNIINIFMYIMFYISLKKYEKLNYGSYSR